MLSLPGTPIIQLIQLNLYSHFTAALVFSLLKKEEGAKGMKWNQLSWWSGVGLRQRSAAHNPLIQQFNSSSQQTKSISFRNWRLEWNWIWFIEELTAEHQLLGAPFNQSNWIHDLFCFISLHFIPQRQIHSSSIDWFHSLSSASLIHSVWFVCWCSLSWAEPLALLAPITHPLLNQPNQTSFHQFRRASLRSFLHSAAPSNKNKIILFFFVGLLNGNGSLTHRPSIKDK